MEEQKKSFWESPFYVSLVSFAFYLALSYLPKMAISLATSLSLGIDQLLIEIVLTVLQVVALQTAIYTFLYNNPVAHAKYLEERDPNFPIKEELIKLFKSFDFWFTAIVLVLLLSILPESLSFFYLESLLLRIASFSNFVLKLFKVLFSILVVLGASLIANLNAKRNWLMHAGPTDREANHSVGHLILVILLTCVVFFACCVVIPLLVPFITSIVKFVGTLNWNVIRPVLITLVSVIVSIELIYLLIGISSRKKFLKTLRKKAEIRNFVIRDQHHGVFPVFGLKNPTTFRLEAYGETYSCILITPKKKRDSLVFKKDGTAYFLKPVPIFKNDLVTLTTTFAYRQEETTDHELILVTRSPKQVFVEENGSRVEITTSDPVFGCQLFFPDNFFGSLDRNTFMWRRK